MVDFINTAKNLLKHHGLHDWVVATNRAMTTAGRCSYRKKTIFISKHHMLNSKENEVLDTIIHEIAHALTPGHKHDAVWKSKAIELGCSGNVYCTTFTKKPFHISCACRKVNLYRYRVRNWIKENGTCRHCTGRVIVERVPM